MSHYLPHLTHKFSFNFLTFFPTTHTISLTHDQYVPCEVPRQSGWSTQSRRDRSNRDWRPRAQKSWTWQESWDRSVSNTTKILTTKIPSTKIWVNLEELVFYIQSDSDSAESIADSDLEDGELRKMLASPMYLQNRKDHESFGMPIATGNLLHCYRREELTTREKRKLNVKFVFRIESTWETRCIFSSPGNSLKVRCSVRQDLNWCSRNTKFENASMSYKNMLMLKDCNYKSHNMDTSNFDENKYDYKKNQLWKKNFSEILRSEVCTKWEKWRALKNYELTKSQCKNWEKVMKQYKGSLHKCSLFKNRWILWTTRWNFEMLNRIKWKVVSRSQSTSNWFQVQSPYWTATNACLLTHGMHLGHRKTFFW